MMTMVFTLEYLKNSAMRYTAQENMQMLSMSTREKFNLFEATLDRLNTWPRP